MFVLKGSPGRRFGRLQTKAGAFETPVFMPIATKASVKHLLPEETEALGAQVLLGNTYHLWLRPGSDLIARAGGLHRFMHWNKPILTDSGGFQVFSLGARAGERFGKNGVKLTEEGVEFSDVQNGRKHFLSPEKSIDIQLELDSDIILVLDECPPYPATHEYVTASVERTTRWAKRCKEHFEKRLTELPVFAREVESRSRQSRDKGMRLSYSPHSDSSVKRPLLFAIVQGGIYEDLRRKSAQELTAIGFDGYAIGGVAVGEPRETMKDILHWTLPELPEDKPRYLMGLGRPEEIVRAVLAGVDMFDCVIPTREGRHGRLFVWKNVSVIASEAKQSRDCFGNLQSDSFYTTVNIQNEQFREDFSPIDATCDCFACKNYTKAYIRHLFAVGEPLGPHMASLHNLRFYMKLTELLRTESL